MKDENAPRMKWLLWPLGPGARSAPKVIAKPAKGQSGYQGQGPWLVFSALLITVQAGNGTTGQQQELTPPSLANTVAARLSPTTHPAVPARLDSMWYVPAAAPTQSATLSDFARGVEMLDEGGNAAEALPLVSRAALVKSPVADYAKYYSGLALQRLNRFEEADAAFASVAEGRGQAQLRESALYRRAELLSAQQDFSGAAAMYELVLQRKPAAPQVALVQLGVAAAAAGDRDRAVAAHRRVLREFTLSAEAAEAERLLEDLGGFVFETDGAVQEELGRAEALFKARRYDLARNAYARVRGHLRGDDEHRAIVRLAQIQAGQGQHRTARDVFRRYLAHPTLGVEAHYGMLAAARAMGDHSEANSLTEDFVARYPDHHLAEEALNEMARRYVLDDDDETAAAVYTRMVDRFPSGAFAERGAWKAGWWAYRQKDFAENVRIFERAAASFPRSDYRPAWLYWTARSYEQMGEQTKAVERYRLLATDYLNTYYGRLTWTRLEQLKEASVTPGIRRAIVTPPTPPPNMSLIKALISAGLYGPALNELQYAQKMWGDSAPLQATIAYVHNRMGNLRLGITAMRRAYPQFMTAGGEDLPIEILHVIFPLDYWPLIKGNAEAQGVDPYIVAALAAQESTFDARIRSSANAVGLMQIIPPTGRRLARRIGMRNFNERSLENPEINARLGTQYFGDMVKEFGGYHFALAGYNAGEHRVRRWNEEAPGLPQDEWIDNIPYPETQNYVKRILGTAEDYRRLYAEGAPGSAAKRKAATKSAASSTKATSKKTPAKKAPATKTTTKKAPAKKSG
jgi:soluble lytic murein transglycosylase